jgi:uncharacterized protein involved in exopolysaccharide biosynthesis
VGTLQEAVEKQKARVLELNRQRDALSVLTRDVESARSAYDTAMQRKAHLRLESEINETAIAVLNPAVPPLRPAFPMLTLNLLVAGVLGTLLGIGAALLVEVSDRRVRLTSDLVEIGGVPVLAVLKRARRRDRARQARAAAAAGAA